MRSWSLGRLVSIRFVLLGLVAFGGILPGPATAAEPATHPKSIAEQKEQQVAEGKDLFARDWRKQGPLNPGSDGLGPMFNEVSCAACHQQGAVGGAGPNKHNVDLLSLVRAKGEVAAKRQNLLRANAAKLHPQFKGNSTLILHTFGPAESDYHAFRTNVTDLLKIAESKPSKPLENIGLVSIQRTQRSTTALFGAGLIDTIPDEALIEAAEQQPGRHPDVSGRVPQSPTGAVGRFGWRGQTATLNDFVLTACAIELGLQVPKHEQSRDPRKPDYKAPALDLTAQQCDSLVAYVASLPAPTTAKGTHLQTSQDIRHGRKLFDALGCAVCHLPRLGDVEGLYSDLLLHDMGPGLADPVGAVPELTRATGGFSSTYYGSSSIDLVNATTNVRQEWRTPPLWGVASSAPYLHDGRAGTLDEAIRLHGGEGQFAATAFAGLTQEEKDRLFAFLNSLVVTNKNGQVATR